LAFPEGVRSEKRYVGEKSLDEERKAFGSGSWVRTGKFLDGSGKRNMGCGEGVQDIIALESASRKGWLEAL